MRRLVPFVALVGGLAIPSCRPAERVPVRDSLPGRTDEAAVGSLTDSTLDELRYATAMFPDGAVTLHKGEWEGAPDSTERFGRRLAAALVRTAHGDISGDGWPDAVVVLSIDPGATGTFYDLIPVFLDSATPRTGAALLRVPRTGHGTSLGDRIRLDTLWVAGERVWLRMVTQGPEDGLCCPTQREERRYHLVGDSLVLEATRLLGRLVDTP